MNQPNLVHLTREKHPALQQVSSEDSGSASIQEVRLQVIEATAQAGARDGQEAYEQGMGLKTVGLFRQAAEHFEKAVQDPAYTLKGLAQMGLSLKKSGKQKEAAAAFRRALQVPSTSSKEQEQILYLLGRTLESLDRIPEALETYRWLLREAPQYRDAAMRIESLSISRMSRQNR